MLWPGDARLVERDPGLPGLAFVLDANAVADWLRRRAPHAGVRCASAGYARYKPATSCLVAYDVECAAGPIVVTAKAFRSPSVEKIQKAERIADLRSVLGPGAFVLHDAMVALTVFPHDLQLRSLRRVMGPSRARVLTKLLPDIGDDAAVSVLAYKPERRLVARVDGCHGRAIVRVYSAAEYAAGAGRRIAADAGSMRLARTLSQHPRYPIVATEWLEGEVGTRVLAEPERAHAIGEAIARLHQDGDACVASWTRSAEDAARHLREVGRGLADLLPGSAPRIEYLCRALAEAIVAVDAPSVLTHGDFAMQQAVFTSDGVALTDLDQAAMAHAASDVGSFIADLEYRSLIGGIATHQTADVTDRFVDGYRSVRPLPPGVEVHLAAQLLHRAPLPFRTRMREWPNAIEHVIDRCESLTSPATVQRSPLVAPRSKTTTPALTSGTGALDPAMPWLEAALDEPRVSRLFENALWRGADVSVESARIVRHKPGRRCLVAYTLRGSAHDIVLGKTRAKGLDRRTAHLNQSLYEGAFSGQSDDRIEVPPFVGLVPELRMWIQAAVAGVPADACLRAGDAGVARRLPDVFGKLQRLGPQPGRTHTIADEVQILDRRLCALAARRPGLRDRLARVLQGCASLAGSLPYSPLAPAHRDFYPDQVIVRDDRLIVLDLDLYALAHPALDAGNCLAHVIELGMRPEADDTVIGEMAGVLRDAIDDALPGEVRPAVDVFTTLTLARLIEIDDRFDHRRACVEPLLTLCEERLSRARVLSSAHHQVSVPAW